MSFAGKASCQSCGWRTRLALAALALIKTNAIARLKYQLHVAVGQHASARAFDTGQQYLHRSHWFRFQASAKVCRGIIRIE